MFGQLKGRVYLFFQSVQDVEAALGGTLHASLSSTSGGPSAMSSALVPGRIRLSAPLSRLTTSLATGDLGPSWSSAIGGGLGRRGELEGDSAEPAIISAVGEEKE